jgi:hypothetical protein
MAALLLAALLAALRALGTAGVVAFFLLRAVIGALALIAATLVVAVLGALLIGTGRAVLAAFLIARVALAVCTAFVTGAGAALLIRGSTWGVALAFIAFCHVTVCWLIDGLIRSAYETSDAALKRAPQILHHRDPCSPEPGSAPYRGCSGPIAGAIVARNGRTVLFPQDGMVWSAAPTVACVSFIGDAAAGNENDGHVSVVPISVLLDQRFGCEGLGVAGDCVLREPVVFLERSAPFMRFQFCSWSGVRKSPMSLSRRVIQS